MKYYKIPGNQAEAMDPDFGVDDVKAYQDYIASVWESLPKELRQLYVRGVPFSPDLVYLNDSGVQSIISDFTARTVEIILLGDALNEWGWSVGARHFSLLYNDVERLTSVGESGRLWPGVDLDHVWDEVEVLEGGLYEHRMLFQGGLAGGIEMSVVFGGFSLTYTDTLSDKP